MLTAVQQFSVSSVQTSVPARRSFSAGGFPVVKCFLSGRGGCAKIAERFCEFISFHFMKNRCHCLVHLALVPNP
jgi:hypothetical protein